MELVIASMGKGLSLLGAIEKELANVEGKKRASFIKNLYCFLKGTRDEFMAEYNSIYFNCSCLDAKQYALKIVEDVLKETVKDISQTDLNEIIKTAVWKPDKNNKSVQRFISRMRDRHTCKEADAKRLIKGGLTPEPYLYEIPELGERFEYVVVENDSSNKVRDKMEYPEPSSEIVLGVLKKLKDGNKAGNNKADDSGMDEDDLDENEEDKQNG
ncbi:hypothetical protein RclHR1_31530001 [Rhizophagus clarus]|uniref:DNA-directed DNA polymerase n=1 Tax=Rhizophagus clarus TaxID=94130 RepID=A0A2Z6S2E4_9GLOM|nr:hypothetical protein RclHR1_31530001 [Rhizophagus clarus]